MRWLKRGAFVLILGYAVLVAVFLVMRHDLIYPFRDFPAQPAGLSRTTVALIPADNDHPEIEVWVAEPLGEKPVILYFMGNSGNLGVNAIRLQEFLLNGYGMAAMAYRGGGGRPGSPSEAGLMADATRLYDALDQLFAEAVPPGRRVIYGTSLGTGIATSLAASVEDEMALILETPFTRLCDAAEAAYPFLPACLVLWDERYDNLDRISGIDTPLLVLHGTDDRAIPVHLGQALFDAAEEPKELILYPGGRHNDLRLHGAGQDTMRFLEGL